MKTQQIAAIKWNEACSIAEKIFKKDKQNHYYWLLNHSTIYYRPEVRRLKEFLVQNDLWHFFTTKETSYQQALISKIFKPLDLG